MSRRHKLIFVALSLFPFVLAMSFRAVDNYQFSLHQQKAKKQNPDYYPVVPGPNELEQEHEFTCHELGLAVDSAGIEAELSELP